MLILSHPNDDILRKKCKEFDFINPPFDPIEFAKEMIKFMYDHNGIGLAANQVEYGSSYFLHER